MNTVPKTSSKASKAEALSTLAIALEKAHEIIKEETGAPRATILVTRALKGRKGHFTQYTPWQNGGESFHEIAFNLEHFTTAEELLSTLIHEVSHSLNFANGISDTSANQYHNKNFKTQAEALGLMTHEIKGKGYASTSLTELGAKRWAKALKILTVALELTAQETQGSAKPKGRNTNLTKAVCPCGQSLRASAGTIASGITCDSCEGGFTAVS